MVSCPDCSCSGEAWRRLEKLRRQHALQRRRGKELRRRERRSQLEQRLQKRLGPDGACREADMPLQPADVSHEQVCHTCHTVKTNKIVKTNSKTICMCTYACNIKHPKKICRNLFKRVTPIDVGCGCFCTGDPHSSALRSIVTTFEFQHGSFFALKINRCWTITIGLLGQPT